MYGASGRICHTWRAHGKNAAAYDIKEGGALHDVTSEAGFFTLLNLALQLAPGGLIVGGPPCSLFIFLSSSFHKRRAGNALGDTSKLPVRLANTIVENTLVLLEVVHKRSVWFVLEQPASSWMFKLPLVVEVFARLGWARGGCQPGVRPICVWMGAYGHELPKCSHLVGTLPTLSAMRRPCPLHLRSREARPAMWRRTSTGVQGGRDLPSAAEYTSSFCSALYVAWLGAACHVPS